MIKLDSVKVRNQEPKDREQVFDLNCNAFPTSDEAKLVDSLRSSGTGEIVISLVAVHDNSVVGHILFTEVIVEGASANGSLLGLGPMSVQPEMQNLGIGSRLVLQGLQECRTRGIGAVFVLGHAEYYSRFGFNSAATHGLHYKGDEFAPYFMVLELRPGVLSTLTGQVNYRAEFERV